MEPDQHLVAGHAQRAQVVQLAHAAALVDGDDVVRMPGITLQGLQANKPSGGVSAP